MLAALRAIVDGDGGAAFEGLEIVFAGADLELGLGVRVEVEVVASGDGGERSEGQRDEDTRRHEGKHDKRRAPVNRG